MSINQKSGRQTFRRRFVSGSLFVSPCPPECNFQSETKIEPDLRLLGEGVAAHLGHQACRWALRDVAYHVRLKQFNTHLNFVPFWKTFVTRKMSAIFGSGLYSTSSNSTIMNENKQVNHSKQETISAIFTHPSPNPSAPQYVVWLIWPNRKFQIAVNNTAVHLSILVLKTKKAN